MKRRRSANEDADRVIDVRTAEATLDPGRSPSRDTLTAVPSRVLRTLLVPIAILVPLNVAGRALVHFVPDFPTRDLVTDLFDVNHEQSIPTLFSTLMLIVSALLLVSIAREARRGGHPYVRHWTALTVVFALLALDEFASMHERLIAPVRALLGVQPGPFWYAWVIPAAIAVCLFVIAFHGFLRHLPSPANISILTAGISYVGGALGMELVGGSYSSFHGQDNMTYVFITTVEETLEMVGIAVFLYGLLTYVQVRLTNLEWRFRIAPPH